MRPDDHKRQKNAAYKKKHGLPGKSNANNKADSGAKSKADSDTATTDSKTNTKQVVQNCNQSNQSSMK